MAEAAEEVRPTLSSAEEQLQPADADRARSPPGAAGPAPPPAEGGAVPSPPPPGAGRGTRRPPPTAGGAWRPLPLPAPAEGSPPAAAAGPGEEVDEFSETQPLVSAGTVAQRRHGGGPSPEHTAASAEETFPALQMGPKAVTVRRRAQTATAPAFGRINRVNSALQPGWNPSASMSISRTLSAAISRPNVVLSAQEEEQLRKDYLEVIQKESWKQELLDVATAIVLQTEMNPCMAAPEAEAGWVVTVKYGRHIHEFRENRALCIGRNDGCDLILNQSALACSRLHCVIFALPEKRRLLVADVGSCVGVRMVERSGPEGLMHSLPQLRRPMLLQWGETAVLQLADQTVVINPKECVICMSRHREVQFPCGHYVCCKQCSGKCQGRCPVCRSPFHGAGAESADRALSMAGPAQRMAYNAFRQQQQQQQQQQGAAARLVRRRPTVVHAPGAFARVPHGFQSRLQHAREEWHRQGKPLAQWTAANVQGYLSGAGVSLAALQNLRLQGVDGPAIAELTAAGIASMGIGSRDLSSCEQAVEALKLVAQNASPHTSPRGEADSASPAEEATSPAPPTAAPTPLRAMQEPSFDAPDD
eukprot:TRINITY_DN9522_c3_g1_i1.p2 TRINITY_DN9522_c3_g1~~TRINITY_DN9522_c3_g1_i1.p2  ORF type:complete len:612 (+),score=182.75 TRINITY_DN9522_c3_g1_i1:70-1836(+)